jgi:hypothetical protein
MTIWYNEGVLLLIANASIESYKLMGGEIHNGN